MAPIITPRQSTSSSNCPNSLSGGAIAGIVLGTIAGTLLVIWMIKACFLPGAPGNRHPGLSDDGEVIYASTRPARRRRSSVSGRGYRGGRGAEYVDYVEKSPMRRSSRSRRGSVASVSRPERVYVSSA